MTKPKESFFDVQLSVCSQSAELRENITVVVKALTESDASLKAKDRLKRADPQVKSIKRED